MTQALKLSNTLQHRVSGHVVLHVTRNAGKSNEVVEDFSFDNLVLNAALDFWMSGPGSLYGSFDYAKVSTQTTAPVAADTALTGTVWTSPPSNTENISYNTTTPPYYATITKSFTYELGSVLGIIGCVGISDSNSGGSVRAATQIKDGGGIPTTLTLTADDQLTVSYALRWYPPSTPVTGVITLEGVDHNYDLRFQGLTAEYTFSGTFYGRITSYAGALNITSYVPPATPIDTFAGTTVGSSSTGTITHAAYSNGTFNRNFTIQGTISQMNISGGISLIALGAGSGSNDSVVIHFTPNLPKTNTKVLQLTFNQSIARY